MRVRIGVLGEQTYFQVDSRELEFCGFTVGFDFDQDAA